MPLTVRQEVSKHLKKMQEQGIIQPSQSSPIVQERHGTQERRLTPLLCGLQASNEIGHISTAPSRRATRPTRGRTVLHYPRFGKWLLASPQDLKRRLHSLFPMACMSFVSCLSNAPAVFQRLMQRVLMGLNPEDGHILIYSRSLKEHITHLRFVLESPRD